MPLKQQRTKMFDSFEGGLFTTHWDWVSGGGIGFGCGALSPYGHGKTLYFNGCGLRMARTVEMDLSRARLVIPQDFGQSLAKGITKTCPCNMQQFLKVEKMIFFR